MTSTTIDKRTGLPAKAVQYASGLLLFLLVWWGGSLLVGPLVLPGPDDLLPVFLRPELYAEFAGDMGLTLLRGSLGFVLAWIVGFPLGLLMGSRPAAGRTGFFPVHVLQGAPPLLWITPLVLWLGTRGAAAPAVAFLVSAPLIVAHSSEARRQIGHREHELFLIYNSRRSTLWRELYIPRLLPAIKSNLHISFMTSVKSALVAEWFAAQDGFGRRINTFYQFFDLNNFFAWALLFLLSLSLLSWALQRILERMLPVYRSTVRVSAAESAPAGSRSESVPLQEQNRKPESDQKSGLPAGRIRASALGQAFGQHRVFDGLSISVDASRPLVLYGPSGCGKTTLLKTLAGLNQPKAGTVEVPQRSVLLFQDDLLLEHRDCLGNVLLPALPAWTADEERRALECIRLWGLGGREDAFPGELSGGMRKRLAMARAWFMQPQALLLDEPFINLDREARTALWARLFALLAEAPVPVIIITHYPEELEDFPVKTVSWDYLVDGSPGSTGDGQD